MKKSYLIIGFVILIVLAVLIGGFFWFKNRFDGVRENLPTFSSINDNLPYDVEILTAPSERIEITGDNKYGDKIDFEVVAGELKLKNNPRVAVQKNGPKITIYKKTLSSFVLSNKGDAHIDSMAGSAMFIDSKNKGNIVVDDVQGNVLTVSVRDNGDVIASGKVNSIIANIVNSAGKINLSGLIAPTATKKDIGTGSVKFHPDTVVDGGKEIKKK